VLLIMGKGEQVDLSPMPMAGITSASLNMSQSQAQWDAIAAIKANSPFASSGAGQSTSSAAESLDAMLAGYDTVSSFASGGGGGDESLAQITERVRAAQQSTIDLFA
jgi:hypothetical protein